MDETLSLVLFSGTDDKLNAAAVLTAGAAAMGRKVNVLLEYWALDAFRADRIYKDHGVAPEAGPEGIELVQRHNGQHWSEVLLTMDLLGLSREDMIDGLDEPSGATAMLLEAQDAVTMFI